MNNKIIVFGGDHHNTLGVIRSLGEAGIKPILILHGTIDSFVAQSKYISKIHYTENEEKGIELLINLYGQESLPPLIICCSDGASHYVDIYYNQLKEKFIFPNAGEEGRITKLMNKETMRTLAEECNLPSPNTWIINKNDTIPEDIIYPCIIKPLMSIEGCKSDIHTCQDYKSLANDIKSAHASRIQIQEFVDKEYEFQLIGCRIKTNETDKIIIPGVSYIIRSSAVSNTGFLRYSPIQEFKDINIKDVEEFIKRTQYVGLFSVEFIKSKTGKTYFMEINFRNDGNSYAVTGAGCNLPYIWAKGMITNVIDKNVTITKSTLVIPELIDFLQNVLTRRISFFHWVKDIIKSDTFLLYNGKDQRPFWYEVKFWYHRAINKIKRNILDVSWNIGFIDLKEDTLSQKEWKINWLKHPYKNRWFADPFILSMTDHEIKVLVEEFYDPIHRGRIAKLTIDRDNYTLKEIETLLELESHLSFPAIYRNGNDIYIYPENSETGSLTIYKLEDESRLIPYKTLHEEPLTDAILTTEFGSPFILSTKLPEQNGNKLYIYKSDKWDGIYKCNQEITFSTNTARNAGDIFHLNNKTIRSAQDCNVAYGKGLVFYEIIFKDGRFEMHELTRMYPKKIKYDQGMHTFNTFENLAVIDARKYRRPFICKSLLGINEFIKKLHK